MDTLQEYLDIMKYAKLVAKQEPLAIWELKLYNLEWQARIP